jgi:spermidine/putrescine transport system ATP-binding protein
MNNDLAMIELRGVTKRFGETVAVERVDLAVRAGEFITLLGPSGCGKTTLLRMLSGFERPSDGTVHIGGIDVTQLPPYRRNVNQVFQSYALFPHLSVRENIGFGLKMQKTPRAEREQRVAEVMAMVELTGLGERKPAQLSGGQRQRVALARAIVPRPDVLLLDEPLSALDAKLRRAVQLELKHLQRRLGLTFLFVTHDQEEALTMSDRIAVMKDGRIEQLGTPSEIYHQPATAFVADFVGEANLFPAELVSRNADRVRLRLPGGLELEARGEGWPATGLALISIRPEKVLVSKRSLNAQNVFTAKVVEEVFQGPLDRLVLETPAGSRLTAVVANESSLREAIHQGDQVHVGLHTDDLVIVRADSVASP